jgi:hypothetical protein
MTLKFNSAEIKSLVIHKVGNKNNDEPLLLSKSETEITDDDRMILSNHFLGSFKQPEFFQFYHETGLELNEVFVYAAAIFDQPEELYEQRSQPCMHLYRQTMLLKSKMVNSTLFILLELMLTGNY